MENENTSVLRIYVSSTDKYEGKLLYEHIVYLAKEFEISGATVLRGIMGYGASTKILSVKLWEITEKLPIVIELIDVSSKIKKFYKEINYILEKSGKGCLVTTQDIGVKMYKPGKKLK